MQSPPLPVTEPFKGFLRPGEPLRVVSTSSSVFLVRDMRVSESKQTITRRIDDRAKIIAELYRQLYAVAEHDHALRRIMAEDIGRKYH